MLDPIQSGARAPLRVSFGPVRPGEAVARLVGGGFSSLCKYWPMSQFRTSASCDLKVGRKSIWLRSPVFVSFNKRSAVFTILKTGFRFISAAVVSRCSDKFCFMHGRNISREMAGLWAVA
jgi:hypothetical protein